MINLLPSELKAAYIYGRRNLVLRKWVFMCLGALIGLGIIGTYGLLNLHQTNADLAKQNAQAEAALTQANYEGVQKQVKDASNSFKLSVKVLGQEVLFSQLIKQIAATIPAKANLTGLTINQNQSAVDISANAIDYSTATQVQVNLSDPNNKIFSKADIINIACDVTKQSTSGALYPCTVNIRALFARNNPYLFINSKGTKP